MADSNQWTKTFAFIPVHPGRNEPAVQKLIRVHAHHEARRQKITGSELSEPTRPNPYQIRRFRLSTSPPKARDRQNSEDISQSSASASSVSTMEELDGGTTLDPALHFTPFSKQGMPTTPSSGVLDPFESLPIAFGSKQQMLLSYCKYLCQLHCLPTRTTLCREDGCDSTWKRFLSLCLTERLYLSSAASPLPLTFYRKISSSRAVPD